MNQFPLFSSGLELANLVVSSDLLHLSWAAILKTYEEIRPNEPVRFKIYSGPNCTIIAFVTSPTCTRSHLQEEPLLSSSTLEETSSLFGFLCTKPNSSFSIHRDVMKLFASLRNELSQLKSQFGNCTHPLIITGYSLGGSVASLFTIWLLEIINRLATQLPLCITFGAPLIGDAALQAILEHSTWNSCFLHVAASQDPVPRLFTSPNYPQTMASTSQTAAFRPIGTFLLCSGLGFTCLEDPEVVLELLSLESDLNHIPEYEVLIKYYGNILEYLKHVLKIKGISQLGELITHPLRAGIVLQLEAIGIKRIQQQQQQNSDINGLIRRMEKWEETCVLNKTKVLDPSKKLNDMKINMVRLEWYKKDCKDKEIGYYDSYKNQLYERDRAVVKYKRLLTIYWKRMVTEAEKKPQREGAAFRKRWLYAGTNYRRMIEPLDIAEFYKGMAAGMEDLSTYQTNGRSQHYVQLEKWLQEAGKPTGSSKDSRKQNLDDILTMDSSFWAHVEEALISCELLKNEGSITAKRNLLTEKLIKFERYVMELIKNYDVSPEIFLWKSSFMKWWREYEKIIGTSYSSPFTEFMKNCHYHQYRTA